MTKKRNLAKFGDPFKDLQGTEKEEKEQSLIKEPNIEQKKEEKPSLQPKDNKNNQFLDQFFEEKQTQEKTHTRKTFVVENELLEEIKKYMKKFGHGFQVRFINEAIRNQLKIVEEEAEQLKGKRRPK